MVLPLLISAKTWLVVKGGGCSLGCSSHISMILFLGYYMIERSVSKIDFHVVVSIMRCLMLLLQFI